MLDRGTSRDPEVGDVFFWSFVLYDGLTPVDALSRHYFVIYKIEGNICYSKTLTTNASSLYKLNNEYKVGLPEYSEFNGDSSYYNNIFETAAFTFAELNDINVVGKMTSAWLTTQPASDFLTMSPWKIYTVSPSAQPTPSSQPKPPPQPMPKNLSKPPLKFTFWPIAK